MLPYLLVEEDSNRDMWMLLATVVAVLCGWYFYDRHKTRQLLKRSNIPFIEKSPEGSPLPWVGHVPAFLRLRPWDVLMSWHTRHGPMIAYTLFGNTMYSIASPGLLRQCLQSKIANVKKDTANVMKPFLSILGTGIVTSEDASWMKQRLKMSHPLRKDVLEIIPRQTVTAVHRLYDIIDQTKPGEEIELGSALRHLTLQVISGSFLSLDAEESDSTFARMYLPIVEEANKRVWHPYRYYCIFLPEFWNYHLNVFRLNRYVSHLIRRRWAQRRKEQPAGERKDYGSSRPLDMLDRVLQSYEKDIPSNQVDITPEAVRQIRDEMKTFMLAGHETSAAMMTWALFELLQDDELCASVRNESANVFGTKTNTRKMTEIPENLSDLFISEACLRESLRRYNVVPIVARRIVKDLYVEDNGRRYFLPKGSPLQVNLQAIHLDPELWPDPLKFDPSRFLQSDPPPPFSFVPFIAGPRNCLGQHLALLESKMVISMLLHRYQFKLVSKESQQKGRDPRHRFMIPTIPQDEVSVKVVSRLET